MRQQKWDLLKDQISVEEWGDNASHFSEGYNFAKKAKRNLVKKTMSLVEVNLGQENDWFCKDAKMFENLYAWLLKSRNSGRKVLNLTVSLS